MESFSHHISGGGPVWPLKSTSPTPGHAPLHITAALMALDEAGDSVRRKAIVTWLQDNIVSLVGPEAAEALGTLLDKQAVKEDANEFVKMALKFQIHLERGIQTPYGAVEEWRRKQKVE